MRPEALVPRAQLYHTGKGHLRWNEQSYGGASARPWSSPGYLWPSQ